jgi:hypothetical protein
MTVSIAVLPATYLLNPASQHLIMLYDEAAVKYRKAAIEVACAFEKYKSLTASERVAIAKMNLKVQEDQIRQLDLQLKKQGEK